MIHLVSGWTTKRKVCTLNLLVDLDGVAEMQTVGCALQSFLLGAAWMAWQKPGRFNMLKKKHRQKGSLLGISHFYIHFRSTFSKQKPGKESIPPWTSQIFFEDVDICRPVDQTLGTPNGGLPGEAWPRWHQFKHHWHPTFGTFLHSNGKKTIHGLLK